jgi:hypothetical protein
MQFSKRSVLTPTYFFMTRICSHPLFIFFSKSTFKWFFQSFWAYFTFERFLILMYLMYFQINLSVKLSSQRVHLNDSLKDFEHILHLKGFLFSCTLCTFKSICMWNYLHKECILTIFWKFLSIFHIWKVEPPLEKLHNRTDTTHHVLVVDGFSNHSLLISVDISNNLIQEKFGLGNWLRFKLE